MKRPVLLAAAVLGVGLAGAPADAQKGKAPLVSPEVHADGHVTFRLRAPKAGKVTLRGPEFQPVLGAASKEMEKGDDGVWSVKVGPLPPGIYD